MRGAWGEVAMAPGLVAPGVTLWGILGHLFVIYGIKLLMMCVGTGLKLGLVCAEVWRLSPIP